ncbi:MAG TPA: DUF3592 domain-containing protein [Polyangiaceae bacterium]|nr:DUF3592 domain-containing protein [Polyangiaceae bacterium]
MPSIRDFLTFGLAYVGMAAFLTLTLGSFNWPRFRALAKHGVTATGHVVVTNCGQHSTAKVRFEAKGRSVEQWNNVPNCTALRPDDSLSVTYLPEDPNVNLVGSASGRLSNETVSVALAALGMPLFVLTTLWMRFRRPRGQRRGDGRAG